LSQEELSPDDNDHNASLSLMRRKLNDQILPDGYSVRCLEEPDRVYRWTEGELRYYPTGQVASSWNTAWREDLVQMDCLDIPIGSPMSMNFDFLTLSRAAKGFSEAQVYSVRCLQEPGKVYRWHEGELHHYPTGIIASSWDEDWREALVEMDCLRIPIGVPMSEKNFVDDSSIMMPSSTQSGGLLQIGGRSNYLIMGPGKKKYYWGRNEQYQFLDGSTANVNVPTIKEFPYDPAQHLIGMTSCMIMEDGELKCWGRNDHGQVGIGYVTDIPIDTPRTVKLDRGLSAIKVMADLGKHSCAIDSTNSVQCWGYNNQGQLGLGDNIDRYTPATVNLAEDVDVVQITLGRYHTCVLDTIQRVHCWGQNDAGQIGIGNRINPILNPTVVALVGGVGAIQLVTRRYHNCVIDINKSVQCWGSNANGQIGIRSTAIYQTIPAIIQLGDGPLGQGESFASQIALGGIHTCVLLDGAQNPLKCWGSNAGGKIGDGSTIRRYYAPTNVVLEGVVEGFITELKAGFQHNCIVVIDNINKKKVFCWGQNDKGQLGDGTFTNRNIPTRVSIDI
jgi:alpha-tubulin suppressor-like RCC1 family protein